jgi:hypothetical protein
MNLEEKRMFYVDLVFVAVIVSLVSVGLTVGRLRPGPWPAAIWFFLLLFFGTWALGAWLQPIGPRVWGTYWVPYAIAAVGISLLLAAAAALVRAPDDRPRPTQEARLAVRVTAHAYVGTAIVFSVIAVVLRYLDQALSLFR